ncbi:FAD/NAD(P)-binding protein [Streptomyces sp. NPDC057702]|uniref:FAD/NAD(P)-binding protein n=1 Tax=unclassified Streptomyces TaxID=2593676 RepID=UPI00367C2D60
MVIVGGGAAGSSVLVQLVDALTRPAGTGAGEAPAVRSVRVVDPRPSGWGLAFGDSDPLLMCNSAVDLNSVRARCPEDFADHLRQRGWAGRGEECVPRSWMAEYCRTRSAQAGERAAAHGVTVDHVAATARAVEVTAHGYRVRLADGRYLPADDVVLCTGVHQPRVPDGFAAWQRHARYLDSPYPSARLRRALGRRPGRVLVLGTHQSAVDAALLLCRDGHRTTLTSPSGQLPAVRASLAAPPHALPALDRLARLDPADPWLEDRIVRHTVEAVRSVAPLPLRRQTSTADDPVRRLREETALAEAGACHWARACAPLIDAAIALGDTLSTERTHALLSRFAPFVNRYVTALALVNARRLVTHLDRGTLRVATGYPCDVSFVDGRWRVRWPDAGVREFDHVVNATGFRPPELFWDRAGRSLYLAEPPPDAAAVDHLAADLRVRTGPAAAPERVWVVGVGTHLRIPFANHLHHVVSQAGEVADRLALPAEEPTEAGPHGS